MKLALLVALSLAFVGVTVVATAPEASACIPPNCPGYMTCKPRYEYVADQKVIVGLDCYY